MKTYPQTQTKDHRKIVHWESCELRIWFPTSPDGNSIRDAQQSDNSIVLKPGGWLFNPHRIIKSSNPHRRPLEMIEDIWYIIKARTSHTDDMIFDCPNGVVIQRIEGDDDKGWLSPSLYPAFHLKVPGTISIGGHQGGEVEMLWGYKK